MFHLVKLVFLLSILSGTATAQWGTVVAQNDTNRFITSQYNYGLVMPHQNIIVGKLDTTITSAGIGGGNAFKVIVGSLLDHEDNCANYSITNGVASCAGSYEKWREMEKSTSWYQADRGDTTAMFPTNYAVTISTGQDSVNIWNRDTAELWMAFKSVSGNMLHGTGIKNDLKKKDGILYVGATGNGIQLIDFLKEERKSYDSGSLHIYQGNVQERNAGKGTLAYSTSVVLTNDNVNTVAAVRDPFGLKDALGRPKHWWVVGTDADVNTYNAHTDIIYKWGWGSDDVDHVAIDDRGFIIVAFLDATINRVLGRDSEFIRSAIDLGAGANHWASDNTGDGDIAWAADVRATDVVLAEPVPWAQNRPRIIYSSAAGVYNLYSSNPASTSTRNQARQRFSSTVNAPLEVGDAVLTLALEDNTTDSSPYGNTMTASGSPGTVAAVFGNGYSSTTSSYLYRTGDTDFRLGTDDDWYVHFWAKPQESGTNGYMFVADETAQAMPYLQIFIAGSTGIVNFNARDNAGNSWNLSGGPNLNDTRWHHIAAVWDNSALVSGLYIDGVVVAEGTAPFGPMDDDDVYIGKDTGTNYYVGLMDDIVYGKGLLSSEAIAKLHAEGRKKLGMGTPVFTRTTDDALLSNNIVDIDALDNGMWTVVFSDAATAQVFDGRIPIQQIAAPAGTVKSVALIQSPGTDSVGVAIGTTTNLKFVQPSVNLRAAMAHQYKEPIHVAESVVVDSAGQDGIFWTANDAIDAAANARRAFIQLGVGTFGPFNADKPSMTIQGMGYDIASSYGTLITNGTASLNVQVSASRVTIRNIAMYTAPGGAGGGSNCADITGAYARMIENIYVDCDNSANEGSMDKAMFRGNQFHGADVDHIASSGSDNIVIVGNFAVGAGGYFVNLGASANNGIVAGNTSDKGIVNTTGTNTVAANEEY